MTIEGKSRMQAADNSTPKILDEKSKNGLENYLIEG